MAECGLWPVIFQQHRAPGGAMWRWAAWLSAPTAGPCAIASSCGMARLYFVPCPLRPFCPFRPFHGSRYRLCTMCSASQPSPQKNTKKTPPLRAEFFFESDTLFQSSSSSVAESPIRLKISAVACSNSGTSYSNFCSFSIFFYLSFYFTFPQRK